MKYKNSTTRWLLEAAKGSRISILCLAVIQTLMGSMGVASALLLRSLIDAAVKGNKGEFFVSAWWSFFIVIGSIGMDAIYRIMREKSVTTLENRIKGRLFHMLLRKEYARVTATHSAEWMNRLTSDAAVVAGYLQTIFPNVVGIAVRLLGAVIAMVLMEPLLVAVLVPGGFILMIATMLLRRKLKRMHKRVQEENGKVRIFLLEHIESMMVVRLFGAEKQVEARADQRMQAWQDVRMKRNRFSVSCSCGSVFMFSAAYIGGAVYCGWQLMHQAMSYGTLTAVMQLINQIQGPFADFSGVMPQYYAMLASAERLMEIEALPDEESTDPEKRDFTRIAVQDLCFTYRDERQMVALKNVNLQINRGEFIAFTGESGCGKSTMLKLLMCLYQPDTGAITVDGLPMTAAWRGLFSYVPQGNQLMSGSIREIVTFGNEDLMRDDEGIKRALRLACADFVEGLENGLDTVLGERGKGLSEGQMQRIAVARAIYANRPVLLLDESTSALDAETEVQLLNNLRSMTDKTVILVSHRPAALEVCDREVKF